MYFYNLIYSFVGNIKSFHRYDYFFILFLKVGKNEKIFSNVLFCVWPIAINYQSSTPCNSRQNHRSVCAAGYGTKIGKAGNNFRREGANMADGRADYRNFMARAKAKRTNQGDNAGHGKSKNTKKGIESIVVQRVNTQPTGKLRKFEGQVENA